MRLPPVRKKGLDGFLWPPTRGAAEAPWLGLLPTRGISKVPRVPQNQYGTSRWSRGISMVSRSAPKLAGGALVRA